MGRSEKERSDHCRELEGKQLKLCSCCLRRRPEAILNDVIAKQLQTASTSCRWYSIENCYCELGDFGIFFH